MSRNILQYFFYFFITEFLPQNFKDVIKSAFGAGRWGLQGGTRYPLADTFVFHNAVETVWALYCVSVYGYPHGDESASVCGKQKTKPKQRRSRMADYRQRWRFLHEKYNLFLDGLKVGTSKRTDGMGYGIWKHPITVYSTIIQSTSTITDTTYYPTPK